MITCIELIRQAVAASPTEFKRAAMWGGLQEQRSEELMFSAEPTRLELPAVAYALRRVLRDESITVRYLKSLEGVERGAIAA